MDWNEILTEYNKAKDALWCPKKGNWRRDEENGLYHLLNAYHNACKNEPKNHLLFARILAMMADEYRFTTSNYYIYHKYIEPSVSAYALAKKSGQLPTDEELEKINFSANSLKYELDSEEAPYKEQIKNIKGYEKLNGFDFHDSKPIYFEHTEKTAKLKLKYDNIVATFMFEDIYEIHVEGDPLTNWIDEFYCYPCFHNRKLFTLDVECYKIVCSSISVEKVEKEDNNINNK